MANYIQYSNNVDARSNNSQEESQLAVLSIPANMVALPGDATDPSRATGLGFLNFGVGADDILPGSFSLPYSWKVGTAIWPRIKWQKTSSAAGTVAWVLSYKWTNQGGTESGSWTSLGEGTEFTSDGDTADLVAVKYWAAVAGTGKTENSLFQWRLRRDVSEDTYASGATFVSIDFIYQVDTLGATLVEYPFNTISK